MPDSKPPAEVNISEQQVTLTSKPGESVKESEGLVAPPTATAEERLQSAGARTEDALRTADVRQEGALQTASQRKVSYIWELVQAYIAATTVTTANAIAAVLALKAVHPGASEREINLAVMGFVLLSNLASLIIGFYFGRSNHQNVGGTGANRYQGR